MRLLLLSTYPAANPIHGGQHRLNQIAQRFEASGYSVDRRGILGSESYPETPGYLKFPGHKALSTYLNDTMLMEDWAIGKYAADPKAGYKKLAALCSGSYDVVFCEQPWLFEFAHRRFTGVKRPPALIYGSQNIEHRLKHEIVEQYLNLGLAEQYGRLVADVELFAANSSSLNVAVSDHDATWLRSVSNTPAIVAANGVVDRRASIDDIRRSNEISTQRKFALYCASGHPPNIQGFYDIFASGLGCLAPEQVLIVAGGAGPHIVSDPRFHKAAGLDRKIIATGEVTESQLRGLLATAHVIILPITRGGGTNLKTAEALWSGRHVVATTTAMRGFEQFTATRGLTVADRPDEFKAAMEAAMRAPPLQLLANEREERSSVLWESTLKGLPAELGRIKVGAQ